MRPAGLLAAWRVWQVAARVRCDCEQVGAVPSRDQAARPWHGADWQRGNAACETEWRRSMDAVLGPRARRDLSLPGGGALRELEQAAYRTSPRGLAQPTRRGAGRCVEQAARRGLGHAWRAARELMACDGLAQDGAHGPRQTGLRVGCCVLCEMEFVDRGSLRIFDASSTCSGRGQANAACGARRRQVRMVRREWSER